MLNQYQKRDGTRVLNVVHALNPQQVHRWIRQLSFAAARLEERGLTHGDIRPANMLLNSDWNLKLSDMDRAIKVGEEIAVITEPFGRLLGKEDGEGADSYGNAGARTERFTVGSVYYALTRGHEPYETKYWGKEHYVILSDKVQKKEFPSLTDSATDVIISKCWNGKYHLVKDLLTKFADGAEVDKPADEGQEWLRLRQVECKEFSNSGSVDTLERY